ncbi:MAG: hypothetical protein ACYTF1_17315 [Planctomycetota bacterium]
MTGSDVKAVVRAFDAKGAVVEEGSVATFQGGEAYLVAAVADGSLERHGDYVLVEVVLAHLAEGTVSVRA